MTIQDALKQSGFARADKNSVALAEKILKDGENVVFAMQGQLYQDLAAKHFNINSIPAAQRYNAVFVITDRRLFFCQSTQKQDIQMTQWLFDIKATNINKAFLKPPVLSITFGFDELQIIIPAKIVNDVNNTLKNAISNCPVTAADVKTPAKAKKQPTKSKAPKNKTNNDDFIPPEADFHTKVVGVTYKNDNGSDRQKIISKCKAGQDVIFKPTPSKEYPEAVGVFTVKGEQLGYLNAELAHDLIHTYPNNQMQATITTITGGNGKNYGCNIHIHIFTNK